MSRKTGNIIYDENELQVVAFSIENEEVEGDIISANQYLIISEGKGFLLDPGGSILVEEFNEVLSNYIEPINLEYIFFSHQDPDVISSIEYWSMMSSAKLVVPKLWERFISHFGILDFSRVVTIDDNGMELSFNGTNLKFLPAHFLHSPGNFSVYDATSKILFSGDIGAAVFPQEAEVEYIEELDNYIQYIEGFHKRYMAGNKACVKWVNLVEELDVSMIAPQHGAIYKDSAVKSFLTWFKELKCGIDLF